MSSCVPRCHSSRCHSSRCHSSRSHSWRCHSVLRHSLLFAMLGFSGCLLDDVTVDENFKATPTSGGSSASSQVGSAQNTGGASAGSSGAGMTAAAGTSAATAPPITFGGNGGAGAEVNSGVNTSTPLAPVASGGASGSGAAGTSAASAGAAGTSAGGSSAGSTTTAPVATVPLNPAYHPEREQACLDYCTLYTTVCAGHPANDYVDAIDCANFCLDSSWPIGDLASVVPGTVTCRYFHAGLAKDQGLTPHCYHAARVPTMGGCQVITP